MNKALTIIDCGPWSLCLTVPLAFLAACGGSGNDDRGNDDGSIVFHTTFACSAWKQSDGSQDADVCAPDDGIAGWGGWTANGQEDEIASDANYAGGGGGSGFRHYRGDGTNVNGGGLQISLPTAESEVWVRFYMRYSSGFAWSDPGNPHYTKEHYWNVGNGPAIIYGIQDGAWGLHYSETSSSFGSGLNWRDSQGDDVGDGQWHCHEYHWRRSGASSIVEIWVDGTQYLNQTVDLGTGGLSFFALGENQNNVTACNSPICYTDYDDLVVSRSARVGCLS